MNAARASVLTALLLAAFTLGGCQGAKPNGANGANGGSPVPGTAPTVAQLAQSESRRVGALRELSSLGVIELSWEDESGKHWEQGDLELSYVAPDRTALAVKKLGEIFIWAGSAGGQYWLFDNRSRNESVAYRGDEADIAQGTDLARMLHPLLVLDLAGLTPLVTEAANDAPVTWDEAAKLWTIMSRGRAGDLRIGFAPETLEPQRVEALDGAGQVVLTSRLSRFARIPVEGLPDGAFPRVAERIEVSMNEGNGTALLALDRLRGEVDAAKQRLVFDFEALRGRLRPARVEPFGSE